MHLSYCKDESTKTITTTEGNLSNQTIPFKFTARNMGKNDRWIAATASVPDMDLLTSGKDFEHLDGAYIRLAMV